MEIETIHESEKSWTKQLQQKRTSVELWPITFVPGCHKMNYLDRETRCAYDRVEGFQSELERVRANRVRTDLSEYVAGSPDLSQRLPNRVTRKGLGKIYIPEVGDRSMNQIARIEVLSGGGFYSQGREKICDRGQSRTTGTSGIG